MIVPGILVCKCVYVYCHIEYYSDRSRRGSHLVKPLCYGVVYCVYYRHCRVLCLVFLLLCKEEHSSPVSAITEDMGLYEVSLCMFLLDFGIGNMLANFHMCGVMLLLEQFLPCS